MEHTTSVDVVYVTSLYKIKTYSNVDINLEHFKPFLNSGLNIVVYTDIEDLILPSTETIFLPRDEIKSFSQQEATLPEYRNKEKDTLEFLQLMNAKSEFLYRAKKLKKARVYVWFDFGILKIIHDKERFIESMKNVDTFSHEGRIVIPGCISKDSVNFNNLFVYPIWRFCGGILIVCESVVDRFYDLHCKELEKCKDMGLLTWEVNLWASIETNINDLFDWYKADHNDTIIPTFKKIVSGDRKIIYLTMIKNESAIITRSIFSALSTCDAICICDTGSTDNTVEIVEEYFKTLTIPCKLYKHTWKNFGHNRSESFKAAVDFCKDLSWNPNTTYALLLDADMRIQASPSFDKNMLVSPGYALIQRAPNMEYYNTRFVQISFPWKCTGVTHEYWDGYGCDLLPADMIFIQDIGDGGCKADKFERDVRLLEQGLKDEPTNERYMFYLAQSYKDSGRRKDSIKMYKKRIKTGGWCEEVWHSMYTLMKLYEEEGDVAKMEMWGIRAYEYRPQRAENIHHLVRYFRNKRQFHKAWHYLMIGLYIKKPADVLFIESDVYKYCFEYERQIIHDFIFPDKKVESLQLAIDYYNKYNDFSSYNNIKWFVQKIPVVLRNVEFQQIGDFIPTSTSFCKLENGNYLLNVRYVNYRIQPDGSYLMYQDGVLSRDHAVRTENYMCYMNSKFNIISPLQKMLMCDSPVNNTHIKGLEDVRIFRTENEIRYLASTMEYSYDGKIRQHTGKYDYKSCTFVMNSSLIPPTDTECEKNWIPYKNKFIYKWHPFQLCSIQNNKLVIESSEETPLFFSHMRGSSNLIEEDGYLWGITHCVIYEQPRKYYHMVVKIDSSTNKLIGYTQPYYFLNNAIEYCLGFDKRGTKMYAFVSQNDSNPVFVEFNESDLVWKYL
jgi:glycosyltransferase involved in cell wall biosynthesis